MIDSVETRQLKSQQTIRVAAPVILCSTND